MKKWLWYNLSQRDSFKLSRPLKWALIIEYEKSLALILAAYSQDMG